MGIHVVLYEPEIPANTGNIARTCLATNTTLHLIHPLGFETSDKRVRRAGLDYWYHVKVNEYHSIDELFDIYQNGLFYYIENFGTRNYTHIDYTEIHEDLFFIFGRETSGLPRKLIKGQEQNCLRIPIGSKTRSLNLSNAVAIVLYEVLRQLDFPRIE